MSTNLKDKIVEVIERVMHVTDPNLLCHFIIGVAFGIMLTVAYM